MKEISNIIFIDRFSKIPQQK